MENVEENVKISEKKIIKNDSRVLRKITKIFIN